MTAPDKCDTRRTRSLRTETRCKYDETNMMCLKSLLRDSLGMWVRVYKAHCVRVDSTSMRRADRSAYDIKVSRERREITDLKMFSRDFDATRQCIFTPRRDVHTPLLYVAATTTLRNIRNITERSDETASVHLSPAHLTTLIPKTLRWGLSDITRYTNNASACNISH